jgi:hypothetical protein
MMIGGISGPSAGLSAAVSRGNSSSRAATSSASLKNIPVGVGIPARPVAKLVGPSTRPATTVNLGKVTGTMPADKLAPSVNRVIAQRSLKANMALQQSGSALRGTHVDLRL